MHAEWVKLEETGEPSTWESSLVREEAFLKELWCSGMLPAKPSKSPAAHGDALRAEGVPEGVPREPWRDIDLGVDVFEARVLSTYANCPAVSTHP